tara:strand:+ start:481 stop:900 length:420 start_codon:yes stop_codon:yes gene_type:complete
MIVFNLICNDCSSEFEGWFDNTKQYDQQKRKKMIDCPNCGSDSIKKTLNIPNLPSKSNSKKDTKTKKTMANNIKKYKKIIEKNFDYVGENFTEEVKKMKYGETKERPVYGEATIEQTKELVEEDINVVPLPWAPSKKTN